MLAETQTRLHERFQALSQERAALGYPVYVLEHDFTSQTVMEIRTALTNELRRNRELVETHWLLWILVATEIGYSYDGDEYCGSFAEAIPEWSRYGDRSKVRDWFRQFARRYRGFQPTGKWAKHFSIIAWPIAHAILPRDLQGQFARRLYERRYELAENKDYSAERLGAIMQTGDTAGSSRFQHFLEQPELTARLLLALRDEDVPNVVQPINSQTMERLVADLELRHSARDWLREARRVLREARLKELIAPKPRGAEGPDRTAPSSTHFDTTRLVARQTSEGGWLVGIKLPDFKHLLQELKFATKMLGQTRLKLTVGAGSWMPGAALLPLGNTEHRLGVLNANINLPALEFEHDIQGLSIKLTAALSVQGSAPWILRIQEDGVARQVIGNHVRAGQSYLILSNAEVVSTIVTDLGLRSVQSGLANGSLYALDMPQVLGAHTLRALANLGLGYALTANIEPLGISPRWDGAAGCMVWLTTEEPLLRLSADHPVREFSVRVDQQSSIRIACTNATEALISLGRLESGEHTIEVGGFSSGGVGKSLAVERFEVLVRPPVPWSQGVREQAGFRATLDPAGASLESTLSGIARISLTGPPERSVTVGARLFNLNGHVAEALNLGSLPSLTDHRSLGRIIARLKDDAVAEKIQTAPRVDLTFVVDELGMDTITFSQRVRPLRWKLALDAQSYRLRLIDEAGADGPVIINWYPINRPDSKQISDYTSSRAGLEVQSPGALFTAILDKKHYAAIVSVPTHLTLRTFQGLDAAIVLSAGHDTPRHMPRLLALRYLWGRAFQTLGPLGMLRKAEVCRALELRIATIFCGAAWVTKLQNCRSLADNEFDQLKRGVGGSPGFAYRLRETDWHGGVKSPELCDEFKRVAKLYEVSDDPELSVLALRLAFAPETIKFDRTEDAIPTWTRLTNVPILARGAFFAHLVAEIATRDYHLLPGRAA